MTCGLDQIGVGDYELDNFGVYNRKIFEYQDQNYSKEKLYKI